MGNRAWIVFLLFSIFISGCVSQSKYLELESGIKDIRRQLENETRKIKFAEQELNKSKKNREKIQNELIKLQAKYKVLEEEKARLTQLNTGQTLETKKKRVIPAEQKNFEIPQQKDPEAQGFKPLSQLDEKPSGTTGDTYKTIIDETDSGFEPSHDSSLSKKVEEKKNKTRKVDQSSVKKEKKRSVDEAKDDIQTKSIGGPRTTHYQDHKKTIQGLKKRLEKQQTKISKLESMMDSLENRMEMEPRQGLPLKQVGRDRIHMGSKSPEEVVTLFDKYYGGPEMDMIAGLTTQKFRNFRPESVWVVETWQALNDLNYQRLDSEIKDSKTEKNRSAILLETRIKTIQGDMTQKEIFYLTYDTVWLIDRLDVPKRRVDFKNIKP
jgi:outer membrane murein-binding lipoprotein Lpp